MWHHLVKTNKQKQKLLLYQQKERYKCIQYQESVPADDNNIPMYPISTTENILLFNKYLKESCKSKKVIPVGRLGLYKYLDMDKAISLSMNMVPLIEMWRDISPKKRYHKIRTILDKY